MDFIEKNDSPIIVYCTYSLKSTIPMKKYLLIPTLLIAAALSASAHCGACTAGSGHEKAAEKAACTAKGVKADCKKDVTCCADSESCCKKDVNGAVSNCDKSKCDRTADANKAAEQSKKAKKAKKACCPAN